MICKHNIAVNHSCAQNVMRLIFVLGAVCV